MRNTHTGTDPEERRAAQPSNLEENSRQGPQRLRRAARDTPPGPREPQSHGRPLARGGAGGGTGAQDALGDPGAPGEERTQRASPASRSRLRPSAP